MNSDPLTIATDQVRQLVERRTNPLNWLTATFHVTETMSEDTARQVLQQLLNLRFLARPDADLAQMLAAKLGVEVQWSHATFNGDGEWIEERGQ